jgi:hypothetical protein
MNIQPDDWKLLFDIRDDLEGEDKVVLRNLIKYAEHMERTMKAIGRLVHGNKGAD